MYNYILEFCDEFEYPEKAKQALGKAYESIMMQKDARERFEAHLDLYFRDQLKDYNQAWLDLEKAAELSREHKYTVHLLFLICLSKHLRERYKDRGISYQIFYDSMCDLKWKLFECHKMYDIWGSFVADWEKGFFTMDLFALGRLHFELIPWAYSYEKDGYQVKKGDTVINIHIPSCGPLLYEDCLDS
ncbi:MAG: DUF5596 domain-containing protein [Clostridiales bacterium]|nr:DUF5596 domain-containing protein [Clostridiales bacterium]